jgi:hypothetical protein
MIAVKCGMLDISRRLLERRDTEDSYDTYRTIDGPRHLPRAFRVGCEGGSY